MQSHQRRGTLGEYITNLKAPPPWPQKFLSSCVISAVALFCGNRVADTTASQGADM